MRWITRRRIAWTAASLLALFLAASVTIFLVIRSDWFYNKVRIKLISVIETATGGRVEIGSFRFDWHNLRAEVRDLVLHGTEPADKPPLLRAPKVVVGLKLISLSRHEVDVQSVTVAEPHIYLIVAPDGSTNIPKPKTPSSGKDITYGLIDAAIGQLTVERGITELEAHGSTPFSFRGENVLIHLVYDRAFPRYRGTFAAAPMHLSYDDYGPEPFQVNVAFAIERGRIAVESAYFADGATRVDATGSLDNLTDIHATFQYTARAQLTDIGRIFRVKELRQGAAVVTGIARIQQPEGLSLDGTLHATDVEYRDATVRLAGFRAQGAVGLHNKVISATRLDLSGDFVRGAKRERIEGRIADLKLLRKDLDLHGVALALLAGDFRGTVQVRNLDRFVADGAISGIDARRAAALFTPESLPWDAFVFGPIRLEGSLRRSQELHATVQATIAPAPSGDPVSGQINATYDARNGGNLDLGRSTISLPHSRADFSGSLNHEMRVHLETTDLNDVLPALGKSSADLPVKLNHGGVNFDGTVTGNLSAPQIAGHMRATSFSYQEESLDSLEADVQVAPDYVRLQNATAVRGPLRAQLQGSLGLADWKTSDASPVSATASLANASVTDMLALARVKNLPLTGLVSASGSVNGTLAHLGGQGDITVTKGTYQHEVFDRFTARGVYANDTVTISNAQLVAGTKQATLNATYHHAPARFDEGRLHFQLNTNPSSVEEIRFIAEQRPDLKGVIQVAASGDIDLAPTAKTPYRINDLQADITAKGIQFEGQPVGDAHLTANSRSGVLHAHLDSSIAGSDVRGDGEWRLEGDYPGSANVQFAKVDLARLKDWLSPAATPADFAGSLEGTLHIEGPADRWQANRAELRIRQFQISATPSAGPTNQPLVVRNSGDLVFRFTNSMITAESAHFTGPGTDLSLTGRIQPELKAPLDLRVDGKADLAFLHDLSPDLLTSGGVTTSASIRGTFGDPQIFGRMEFKNANFNIADVPNGIAGATGAIVFNKDRAQIESLTGETGGGRIQLTGFASYGGSRPAVFRLHANATEVRVRYPEGVSTVANAQLNLTGTVQSSMLSGTVTVLRTGVNLQSDFSGILAKSAEPIQTPSAKGGLLGGMSFDIQIDTAPDIQLQSALTENVQAEATLRLRGTASNPALLGRISITQGKLTFFGTQYNLSQGSIAFYNPVRIEPIINIDLETKVRGIDIILTVSGPLNKLTLTPRSDPPLQFSEIVALLATGRAPTSDPSLWTQQNNSQSWQQLGASALLGSAIANPVAGRLQRFFGVSKLRIDPTIAGVDNTPQAKVTVEQQVTPAVTFTYIQNVAATNSQVIRVEWAFSKQWSAVALRDENGLFGLDFYYKKRFK
jgi:translocation and assembly module TamB